MSFKTYGLIFLAAVALYTMGRYSRPSKVTVTHTEDTTKDQIIAELKRQLAFSSSQKISITTTVERPDGTRITRVKLEDKTITLSESETKRDEATHETKHEVNQTITENSAGIVAGPLATFATTDLAHPLYGGFVDTQLFLNIHGLLQLQVGPAVGVAFTLGAGLQFK